MRIGTRLTVCFASILVLFITGSVLSLWQFRTYDARVQELDQAARQMESVQRVNLTVLAYQQTLQNAVLTHDARRLTEVMNPFKERLTHAIDLACEQLQATPEQARDHAMTTAVFAYFRNITPGQIDTALALANAQDWPALELRLSNQVRTMSDVMTTLMQDVEYEASRQRERSLDTIHRARRRALFILIVSGLCTLVLAGFLALHATRSIVTPVRALQTGAMALGKGDLHVRVATGGSDEFAILAASQNQAVSQLEDLYASLEDRVRERTMELEVARNAAEEGSRSKSEFMANMSHEIRTPMNAILGMTELALETNLNGEQKDYLGCVKSAATSLLNIINDVLDFSKIEAGKFPAQPVVCELRPALENVMKMFSIGARQKGLELRFAIDESAPEWVVADIERVRQVLVNLMGNAIKFTQSGEVELRVKSEAAEDGKTVLHFGVRDTGIGIPEDRQQAIFEAFAQADGSITRRFGGTGLGLTISARIVEAMKGRLWVDSRPGLGSTFHFTLPCGVARAEARQEVSEKSMTVSSHTPVRGRAKRILLAEDNEVNQRLAVRLLEKQGHSVATVWNGLEAVERSGEEEFDVILMDVQMPEMDGLRATELIRERERKTGKHAPIFALTAHAMKGDKERCLEAGMDWYLSKPIRMGELAEALDGVERISAA